MGASSLVEVSRQASTDGRFEWVGLVNHSGQNGTAFHRPPPIFDVPLRLRATGGVKSVRLLRSGTELDLSIEERGWLKCMLPRLDRLEIVLYQHQ